MLHVSSRSGVATLRTAIHLLLTYLHRQLTSCLIVRSNADASQLNLHGTRDQIVEEKKQKNEGKLQGGPTNIRLTADLPTNLPVKKCLNRLRFDIIIVTSLWPQFFGPPCK